MANASKVIEGTAIQIGSATHYELLKIFNIRADKHANKNVNLWLDDMEQTIGDGFVTGNASIGYNAVNVTTGVIGSGINSGAFKEIYATEILRLSRPQLAEATIIRNNLAYGLQDGKAKALLEEFEQFSKSSLGMSLEQKKTQFLVGAQKNDLLVYTDKLGRQWKPDAYAEMLQRTQGAEINSIITTQTMQENDLDVVLISQTGTISPICIRYDGKYFSLNGLTPSLPLLDMQPPYHPNCKHVMLPQRDYQTSMLDTNSKVDNSDKTKTVKADGNDTFVKQKAWYDENRTGNFVV